MSKKNIVKKISAIVLVFTFIFSTSINAFASEKSVYEKIVDEYNQLYNVSLKYVEVSPDTDVDKYSAFISDVAKGEHETLNYIVKRLSESNSTLTTNSVNSLTSGVSLASTSSHVTTATKTPMSASYPSASAYNVTCTYTCFYNSYATPAYTVGNVQSVNVSMNGTIFVDYAYIMSSYSVSYLDAGRHLGISTRGTVLQSNYLSGEYLEISGVTTYTEFGYQ